MLNLMWCVVMTACTQKTALVKIVVEGFEVRSLSGWQIRLETIFRISYRNRPCEVVIVTREHQRYQRRKYYLLASIIKVLLRTALIRVPKLSLPVQG